MKRKLLTVGGPPLARAWRGRQPQVSCDFCRRKKLKCDRGRPCSNCLARKEQCQGPPSLHTISETTRSDSDTPAHLDAHDVLKRLQRLEQAVFSRPGAAFTSSPPSTVSAVGRSEQDHENHEDLHVLARQRPSSSEVNYPEAPDAMIHEGRDKFTFRLADPARSSGLPARQWRCELARPDSVLLPAKEDCLSLLDHFLHTSHFLPLTIHLPSARSTIGDICSSGLDNDEPAPVKMAKAAFTLSICAMSAFCWEKSDATACPLFNSTEDAVRQARVWLRATWDLLDRLRWGPCSGSFLEVQASMNLGDLIYNIEGCSSRYRYLHSHTISIAHEISLHLIDAPSLRRNTEDNHLTEVKRRVWWHIASTNWLLSVMGGPHDRTYTIQPHHMAVNFPANVNENDPFAPVPMTTATDMTYFILRTRLAEVCRKVADALPLGTGDIDELPYGCVLSISRLFDEVFASIPPCFQLNASIPPDAPPTTSIERRVIHLAFHARRARIFRPFLHPKAHQSMDQRLGQFRSLCLRSARSVIEIASTLVRQGLSDGRTRSQCSGTVISHLFIACVVLFTHPVLAATGNASEEPDPEAEVIRGELADARQLLERAAEVSPITGNLVNKLANVLRRHRSLLAVPAQGPPSGDPQTNGAFAGISVNEAGHPFHQGIDAPGSCPLLGPSFLPDKVDQHGLFGDAPQDGFGNGLDFSGGQENDNRLVLDSIEWPDLTMIDNDGWGQIFADLDPSFAAPL